MERDKVNTRALIKGMIEKHGSRAAVAVALNCTESYVYGMEAGKHTPGKYLFEKIVEMVDNE